MRLLKAGRAQRSCGSIVALKTYDEHVDAEPISPAVVSLLWFEGPLHNVFKATYDDGCSTEPALIYALDSTLVAI